jgi:hypothetical protein
VSSAALRRDGKIVVISEVRVVIGDDEAIPMKGITVSRWH